MYKAYAGIGSRQTPAEILRVMEELGRKLALQDWTLRSGGATGADSAFEMGVGNGKKEIFLAGHATEAALVMAKQFHPNWNACGEFGRKLHARNCLQVLGRDLNTPSKFIVCWTPDGSVGETTMETGGTGQAIRIAHAHQIPIFNLKNPEHLERVKRFI